MTMGEKILALRKARGWSQEELAEHIGVTRQAVSRWESGAAKPDADKIIAICDLFGVSADYLLRDYAGNAAAEPVQTTAPKQTTAIGDAIRRLTLKQWGALSGFVAGLLTIFILKILSGVFPCVDVLHLASGAVRVYDGVWGFLRLRDLEWLWYLALVAAFAGGAVLFGRPLLQWIKKVCGGWWDDLATFFNWNG